MLIRGWSLDRLLCEEADGAGEGASGGAAVVDAPVVDAAPEVTTTATGPLVSDQHAEFEAYFDSLEGDKPHETSTETVENTPAPKADTSATEETVETSDDETGGRTTADAGGKAVEVQRDGLASLAEAYGWSKDELKGFTREQLQRLIAKEEARLPKPETAKAEPEAEPEPVAPKTEQRTVANQFAEYETKRREQLAAQGFESDYIDSEIERDRLLWNGNQELQQRLDAAEQRLQQERLRNAQVAEMRDFDSVLGRDIAASGFQDLLGAGTVIGPDGRVQRSAGVTDEHLANRKQVLQLYVALKQARPGVPQEALVWQAFNGVFGKQIQHRDTVARSNRMIEHSKRRMGSASPTSPQKGVEWKGPTNQDPEIVSAWQRVQAEKRQRVGSR